MSSVPLGADVANGDEDIDRGEGNDNGKGPTFLNRESKSLHQVEGQRPVDANLLQRSLSAGASDEGKGPLVVVPIVRIVAPVETGMDVLPVGSQGIVKGGGGQGIVVVLPPVGAGLPIIVGVFPLDEV